MMLTIFEEAALLAEAEVFRTIPVPKLRQLVFACERFEFADGEVIIHQGVEAHSGYLIVEGEVDISIDIDLETRDLATIGPGNVVGDHALVEGGNYLITATANGPTQVLRISRDVFLQLLDGNKELLTEMLRVLSERKSMAEQMFGITFDET